MCIQVLCKSGVHGMCVFLFYIGLHDQNIVCGGFLSFPKKISPRRFSWQEALARSFAKKNRLDKVGRQAAVQEFS
jgi:hypothetical protein